MNTNEQKYQQAQDFVSLAYRIKKDVRKHPENYRKAGEWLDEFCSEKSYTERLTTELKELPKQPLPPELRKSREKERNENIEHIPSLFRIFYFQLREAGERLLKKYNLGYTDQNYIPEQDSRRIILITWLGTYPNTEQDELGITQLEKWSWELSDDSNFGRRCAICRWDHYTDWMYLADRTWTDLASGGKTDTAQATPETERNKASSSPKILGDTFTIWGCEINWRVCWDKFKKLTVVKSLRVSFSSLFRKSA